MMNAVFPPGTPLQFTADMNAIVPNPRSEPWHVRTWVHFLARQKIHTNNYILLQFPKETNTRGSKTLTYFSPFHTNLQSFD